MPAALPDGSAGSSASPPPILLLKQLATCLGENFEFDRSQFRIQPDGTFRISIRAMASMAGVDDTGLGRSLKSAADENALPCARSLVAQGFCPADVKRWGETGGIPEDAAPFILEHYGIHAVSPSSTARKMLLAFTRVGINAYLKEKLGLAQRQMPEMGPSRRNCHGLFPRRCGQDFRASWLVWRGSAQLASAAVSNQPMTCRVLLRQCQLAQLLLCEGKPQPPSEAEGPLSSWMS